jgi:hypothetical protein
MDWIVCGDFASIACGTWIALLSGAAGAFISAVLGGLVALLVVRLTNAQQRRGAERAVEIAAIADFISALEEAWHITLKRGAAEDFDPRKHKRSMSTAVIRLGMSGEQARPVADVMTFWPHRLTDLMKCQTVMHPGDPHFNDVFDVLNHATSLIFTYLPRCTDPLLQKAALRRLKELDEKLEASAKLLDGPWRRRRPGRPRSRRKYMTRRDVNPL